MKTLFSITFISFFLASIAFGQLVTTIADVQDTTGGAGGGDSHLDGQIVTVEGIISGESWAFGGSTYYIQDGTGPWSGIMVYHSGGQPNAYGDSIRITATVTEYFGMTRLTDVTEYVKLDSGITVEPTAVTSGEIGTDGVNAEAYESVLVNVRHVDITNPDLGFGEWEIDDGSGPCRVDDAADYYFIPANYDSVRSVVGLLNFDFSNTKIEPRLAYDVVEAGLYTRIQRIQHVRYSDLLKTPKDEISDISYLIGDTITVRGVVTMPTGLSYAGTGIKFIFSESEGGPWSAILSYNPDSTAYPTLFEGDIVEMTGYIAEYSTPPSNMTEIWMTSPINITAIGQPVPDPHYVTTGDLRLPATGEQWGNVMVYIKDAVVVDPDPQFELFEVDDGTGSILVDDDSENLTDYPDPPLGTIADSIRGWVYHHFGAYDDSSTYKLEPLYTTDIVLVDGAEELEHFNNVVAPTGRAQPIYIVDAFLYGEQLQPGDEVGVFDGDLLVGATKIQELPMADPITVYLEYTPPGGDPLTGAQDGNDILFRVWDRSADREECANISEVVTGEPVFSEGTIVAVSLEAPCEITQSIELTPNFLNLISFYVPPVDNSVVAVFDSIFPVLVIVQDHDGLVYIPPDIVFPGHPGTNTIDTIDVKKGYQVFINSEEIDTLEVIGLLVDVNETPIPLQEQFLNKISFPLQDPMMIVDVFSPSNNEHVYTDLSIVQDHDGNVYIPPDIVFPGHPGSNTIDDLGMQPGRGYMLYHRNAEQLSFTYPEPVEGAPLAKLGETMAEEIPNHYTCIKTGEPHALFLKNINVELAEGDEFGVFADGKCVGSMRYVGDLNDPLIIWQVLPDYNLAGVKDGDKLEVRLWRHNSEMIEILKPEGDIKFSKDRIFSLIKISSGMKTDGLNLVSDIIPKEMGLRQNYPNPFNPTTTIEISLNKDTDVSLMIYNIRGEVVRRLVSGHYAAGRYQVEWDGRNEHGQQVASSIYLYRIQAESYVKTKKMIFAK